MFDTKEIPVTLANFNARSELNGEDRKPAADISCRLTVPASMMEELVPGICEFLYKAPDQPDLVDQADTPSATALRFPALAMPLKLAKEFLNYHVEIDYGLGGDSNKHLHDCTIHKFSASFLEGGSANVAFMISTHPDSEMAGWLYDNPDLKTKMVFHAPEQPQADMLAPKRQTKKEKSDAALAEAQAIFEKTAT